jgi:predicted RNase H-like HicB family nuclease
VGSATVDLGDGWNIRHDPTIDFWEKPEMRSHAFVRAAWDNEAKVWYVEASDISGLVTESETLEGLRQRIRDILPDLLAGIEDVPEQIEIDLIAHAHDRVLTAA